jgi:hypothetical protein
MNDLNQSALERAMPEPTPKVPLSFIVVTFSVAIIVAAAIIYFGINGQLGGPIP